MLLFRKVVAVRGLPRLTIRISLQHNFPILTSGNTTSGVSLFALPVMAHSHVIKPSSLVNSFAKIVHAVAAPSSVAFLIVGPAESKVRDVMKLQDLIADCDPLIRSVTYVDETYFDAQDGG